MIFKTKAVLAALTVGAGAIALTAPTLSASALTAPSTPSAKPTTTRVGLSPRGAQLPGGATGSLVSGDGKVVLFSTYDGPPMSGGGAFHVRTLATGKTVTIKGDPMSASISRTGRYVAFTSYAANLVRGDTNNTADVFRYDTKTQVTTRVSVNGRTQSNGYSDEPAISADGRFVTFLSDATNLARGTKGRHTYLHDTSTGKTSLVTVTPAGAPAKLDTGGGFGGMTTSDVSADGRYVTFASGYADLVAGDSNKTIDVFVRDLVKGKTTLVSKGADDKGANDYSAYPTISADGKTVAFTSSASNLVGGTRGVAGVYVRNLRTGVTEFASVNASGAALPGRVSEGQISGDGRSVAFTIQEPRAVRGGAARDPRTSRALPMSRVFVRNLALHRTTLVSVTSAGASADQRSYGGSVSDDGTRTAFTSEATNLVAGDTNGKPDAFLRTTR